MRPLTAAAGVVVAALALACGGVGSQTRTTTATTAAPRPERPPAEAAPSGRPVRDFDKDAYAELAKAFAENPVAARGAYADVRWRLKGPVQTISEAGAVVLHVRNVGPVGVTLPDSEVVKLKTGREAEVVARLRSVGVDWADRTNAQFKGGVVAGGPGR